MLTKAAHLCGRSMPRHIVNGTHQDVTFTFGDNGTKTGDVNAMLKMKNLSLSVRSVHVTMVAVAAHNTGVPAMEIKRCTETVQLDARQGRCDDEVTTHCPIGCCGDQPLANNSTLGFISNSSVFIVVFP